MPTPKEVTATLLRRQLASALKHVLEDQGPVHITKHGKTIAILQKAGEVTNKAGEVVADVVVKSSLVPLGPVQPEPVLLPKEEVKFDDKPIKFLDL